MDFSITTKRLQIKRLDVDYIEDYHREFTDEIARFQYHEPFKDLNQARDVLSGFIEMTNEGKMLELMVLGLDGEFIGSIEVFELESNSPCVGIWLKKSNHRCGLGHEALAAVLAELNKDSRYESFIYEADVRNDGSIRLAEKFRHQKGSCKEVETESGKRLCLRVYQIFV